MAPTPGRKRKRQSNKAPVPRKRTKVIREKRTRNGIDEYLVEEVEASTRKWTPSDQIPDTAIAEWVKEKEKQTLSTSSTTPSTEGPASSRQKAIPIPAPEPRRRGRPKGSKKQSSRSVNSKPPTPTRRSERNRTRAVSRSSTLDSSSPTRPSPNVVPSQHDPSSLEGYTYISRAESDTQPRASQQSIAASSQRSIPYSSASQSRGSFRSTGVVLESEPEDEEEVEEHPSASYVPTTQTTGATSHSTSSPSHHNSTSAYWDTAISTSLEPPEPHSDAPSIPETEPEIGQTGTSDFAHDIFENSVVANEPGARLKVESLREIPDTFETGASLSTLEAPSALEARLSGQEQREHPIAVEEAAEQKFRLSTQEEFAGLPQGTAEEQVAPEFHGSTQEELANAPQSTPEEPLAQGAQYPFLGDLEIPSARVLSSSTQDQHRSSPRWAFSLLDESWHETDSKEQSTLDNSFTEAESQFGARAQAPSGPGVQGHTIEQAAVQSSQLDEQVEVPSAEFQGPLFSGDQHKTVSSPGSRSRHDSSQESPISFGTSADQSSSVPQPPEQSLGTFDITAIAPPRPRSPKGSSSSVTMSTNEPNIPPVDDVLGIGALLESYKPTEAEKDAMQKARALERRKRIDKRRAERESLDRSRSIEQQMPSETGTRSPSTIPNQPPTPQAPTSLGTVVTSIQDPVPPVLQNETVGAGSDSMPVEAEAEAEANLNVGAEAGANVNVQAEAETETEPTVPEKMDLDESLSSELDAEESLLNDELELQEREYVVPLPMRGRQADMYRDTSKKLSELLALYDQDPQETNQRKIENVLHELRNIETHTDLVWAGNQISHPNDDQFIQDKALAQWSYDMSAKFRFISALLSELRERQLHVILVVEKEDNARLFEILESFLRGKSFSFESLITAHTHVADAVEGSNEQALKITVLSSTCSQLTREAHLILCVDGKPDAMKIRQKPWAVKPDRSGVPLLQLTIPRTVGHIDHFLSPGLSPWKAFHAIIACLSQFASSEDNGIGKAVNFITEDDYEVRFANQIKSFLFPVEDEPGLPEWPLPQIGNIKEIIEYQTQQSQETSHSSSLPVLKAAAKRPLIQDDGPAGSSKRMCLTPQLQTQADSRGDGDNSHTSASASGSLEHQRDFWKEEAKRLQRVEKDWVQRQWNYEEMNSTYSALLLEKERLATRLAESEAREARSRAALDDKTNLTVELRAQLEEQRNLNLYSDDEKISEITRLKGELATAKLAEQKAVREKAMSEENFATLQTLRDDALAAAKSFKDKLATVEAQLAATKPAAPDPEALRKEALRQDLLRQHAQRQERLAAKQDSLAAIENRNLKRQNQMKELENERLKADMERMKMTRGVGGGTRAVSVGARTPRPGSRAASPQPQVNGRDRLANLRNG